MDKKHYNYYQQHETRRQIGENNVITYSFNNIEKTIIGLVEEKDNLIYLYEYRGKYIGTEFLISFSAHSTSYKFLKIKEKVPV
ncbi:MAG: hypothetical protein NVS1B13_26070 [Flavisolibacter sp.]